ncbi:MAG: hypothetical protein ACYTG2_00680 [Planctomycetota bacterium]
MAELDWRDMGYLTPDAPECQQDVWALLGRLQTHLATAFDELGLRTVEPTWAASLAETGGRSRDLARDLEAEAGADALVRLADDEAVRTLDGALAEVLGSGHVPAVIVTGYVVLGELGMLPARLLEDLAGPYARPLAARVAASDGHAVLARLFGASEPAPADRENLRRMLRHLDGQLATVHATWRQTFHVLGLDGENLEEGARECYREAAGRLGLKVTAADLAVFRV